MHLLSSDLQSCKEYILQLHMLAHATFWYCLCATLLAFALYQSYNLILHAICVSATPIATQTDIATPTLHSKCHSKSKPNEPKMSVEHELSLLSLQPKDVLGDGACSFRAIATSAVGSDNFHPLIRFSVVDYICQHFTDIQCFLEGDHGREFATSTAYRDWFLTPVQVGDSVRWQWSGHAELLAFCLAFKMQLCVHPINHPACTSLNALLAMPAMPVLQLPGAERCYATWPALHVLNVGEAHYMALVHRDGSAQGCSTMLADLIGQQQMQHPPFPTRSPIESQQGQHSILIPAAPKQPAAAASSPAVPQPTQHTSAASFSKSTAAPELAQYIPERPKSAAACNAIVTHRPAAAKKRSPPGNVADSKPAKKSRICWSGALKRAFDVAANKPRHDKNACRLIWEELQQQGFSVTLIQVKGHLARWEKKTAVSRQLQQARACWSDAAEQSFQILAHKLSGKKGAAALIQQELGSNGFEFTKRQVAARLQKWKKRAAQLPSQQKAKNQRNSPTALPNNSVLPTRVANADVAEARTAYERGIAEAPEHVCSCCWLTYFPKAISELPADRLEYISEKYPDLYDSFYCKGFSSTNQPVGLQFCTTCKKKLMRDPLHIPERSALNGTGFPPLAAAVSCLSRMEERLVARIAPFMYMVPLKKGRQWGLVGKVVSVPMQTDRVQSILPRPFEECQTLLFNFKRKMEYSATWLSKVIDVGKVVRALQHLITTPLYRDVSLRPDLQACLTPDLGDDTSSNSSDSSDTESTDPEHHEGATLLDNARAEQLVRSVACAPAEGNRPINVLSTPNAEQLAFPTIWCGQPALKHPIKPLSVAELALCHVMHVDRRMAQHAEAIFFNLRAIQLDCTCSYANTAVRKQQLGDFQLTAAHARDHTFLTTLVQHNLAENCLKKLRTSPDYEQEMKRDLMAMVRQLQRPTFFITFSQADCRWPELLTALSRVVDDKDLTDAEIAALSGSERQRLVRAAPATVTRYYEHRKRVLLKLLKADPSILGRIDDHFFRDAEQARAAMHTHGLTWVEGAPHYTECNEAEVCRFIDQHITCSRTGAPPELIALQRHVHSKGGCQRGHKPCRFHCPWPPMQETRILCPLTPEQDDASSISSMDTESSNSPTLEDIWKHIKSELDSMYASPPDISFHEFLANLNLTEETYLRAIRSTLLKPRVFLRRDPAEISINAYNPVILKLWQANMDVQFVLDEYAAVVYIVNYMATAQRNLRAKIKDMLTQAQQHSKDLPQSIRAAGAAFMNHQEIGIQYALYILLQLHITICSREVMFIPTSPSHERMGLVKTGKELQDLPDKSTNVYHSSIIDHFKARPAELGELCLAKFGAWYNCTSAKLQKRRRAKVLKFMNYSLEKDPENYCREQVMLYTPWREDAEVEDNPCATFLQKLDTIRQNRSEFDPKHGDIDWEAVEEEALNAVGFKEDLLLCDEPVEQPPANEPVGAMLPLEAHSTFDARLLEEIELAKRRMEDAAFSSLMQILNPEQRACYKHCLHWLKTKVEPFSIFLTGGAGTGKTLLTSAICEGAARWFRSLGAADADQASIMKLAPTGNAAFLLQGSTVHNGLNIRPNQSLTTYIGMSRDSLQKKQEAWQGLQMCVLDEVSMIGGRMFAYINGRLQDLKDCSTDFGGLHMLASGDFYQVSPVKDCWIFKGNDGALDNPWRRLFSCYELTTIMRQQHGGEFAEMLNQIRGADGSTYLADVIAKLSSRLVRPADVPKDVTHIFQYNAAINKHNQKVLSALHTEAAYVTAKDRVITPMSASEAKSLLAHVRTLTLQESNGMAYRLGLKICMPVEYVYNYYTADGLTNGAPGIVRRFDRIAPGQPPFLVWVEFERDSVGQKTRAAYRQSHTVDAPPTWTPIIPIEVAIPVHNNFNKQFSRLQFPLRLAAAKSIYTIQGRTMRKAAVDLRGRACHGCHYTALSRVTKLEDLYIINLAPEKIHCDSQVKTEMEFLRSTARLQLCVQPLQQERGAGLFAISHNARSALAHWADIQADPDFAAADVLHFTETHDSAGTLSLPNCSSIGLASAQHGSELYLSPAIQEYAVLKVVNTPEIELVVVAFTFRCQRLAFIGAYRAPHPSNLTAFLEKLQATVAAAAAAAPTLLLMGDFNINLLIDSCARQRLCNLMAAAGLRSALQQRTTDYFTCLDHVWTTASSVRAGTTDAYWSDHKIVWAALDCSSGRPQAATDS